MQTWDLLAAYLARLIPAVALGAALLVLLNKRLLPVRIVIYIGLFIVIRDTMTPLGLWTIGSEGGLWLRFIPDTPLLFTLGLGSLLTVAAMYFYDSEARELLVWFKGGRLSGVLLGIASSVVVVLPMFILYLMVPIEERGGSVPFTLMPGILVMALLGNLYEEVLFRGYLQGYVERQVPATFLYAPAVSAIAFGFGHSFLALTVTDIGWTLLAFATWEGFVAGIIRAKYGVIPATLTHGLAIFILAGGLF